MGVNVLQELSAEQTKFKAEMTEDRFRYKNHVLDLSQPINEPKFLLVSAIFHQSRQVNLSGLKGVPNKVKANGNISLFP
jgi:hypothetical protein